MIKIIDNFLTEEEYYKINEFKFLPRYSYGESDLYPPENPIPNGMSLEVSSTEEVFQIFLDKTKQSFEELKNLTVNRMYINCFAPSEWSYYHTDSENFGYTCLYYLNDLWEINDGGETHFYIDNEIIAIPPMPNRVVCFDSTMLHKATPFKNKHRFTVAIKYE